MRSLVPRVIGEPLFAEIVNELHDSKDFHSWQSDAVATYVAYKAKHFSESDLEAVFEQVNIDASKMMALLTRLKRNGVLKSKTEQFLTLYFMEQSDWENYNKRYAAFLESQISEPEPEKQEVSQSLKAHMGNLPHDTQNIFLEETIKCLQVGAYRAAIVMGWNLAYDHLLRWLLDEKSRLDQFNNSLTKRIWRKGVSYPAIEDYEGFSMVKESIVIEECGKAGLISDEIKHFKESLDRRNRYAHPNEKKATAPIAAGHIDDLLQHIVLNDKIRW